MTPLVISQARLLNLLQLRDSRVTFTPKKTKEEFEAHKQQQIDIFEEKHRQLQVKKALGIARIKP